MFRRALLSSTRHARRPSRLAMNRPPPSFSPKPIGATTSIEWPRADRSSPSVTTRSFAGKKNKKKGGGGKGGGDEGVTLMYYWDDGDPEGPAEYEDEDEVVRFKKPPSLNDINKKMEMEYGFPRDAKYQYYMDGQWNELKNATQLKAGTKGTKGPVWIRMDEGEEEMMSHEEMMSEEYGEDSDEDSDEEYGEDYDKDYGDEGNGDVIGVKGTIRDLAKKLRDANASALPTEEGGVPTLKRRDGTTMSTREYVLLEAKKDKPLQDLLLREVGGLDHIVQCLHFDFVWEEDE